MWLPWHGLLANRNKTKGGDNDRKHKLKQSTQYKKTDKNNLSFKKKLPVASSPWSTRYERHHTSSVTPLHKHVLLFSLQLNDAL